jgi:hypothetical protein
MPGWGGVCPRQSTAIGWERLISVATTMTQFTDSHSTGFSIGSWVFSPNHGESVRILDVETSWNHTVCQVWVPRQNTVERLPAEALAPREQPRRATLDRLIYAAAAARIADALTQDLLLAPLERLK